MKDKIIAYEEITVGEYELSFSLKKMIQDLRVKEDLICSVAKRGKYELILRFKESKMTCPKCGEQLELFWLRCPMCDERLRGKR